MLKSKLWSLQGSAESHGWLFDIHDFRLDKGQNSRTHQFDQNTIFDLVEDLFLHPLYFDLCI